MTTPLHAATCWSLSPIDTQNWVKNISDATSTVRYPIKLLRYWFMYHLIREQQIKLGRPLRVCEIGVDRGQMRRYVQDAGFTELTCWEAVDYKLQPELNESGYTKQIQANVDLPEFALAEQYDVIIVLHLLEHLFEPEKLAEKLATSLTPNGILIGGFPDVPQFIQAYRQATIRKTAADFGHVSTFSPQRVQAMARQCGLKLEFLSGTYFLRKRRFVLENYPLWVRLNLLWGALCPSLGSELYWSMRNTTE